MPGRKRRKLPSVGLKPPADLPAGAVGIWKRIVGTKASGHFDAADEGHLTAYVWAEWRYRLEVKRDKRKAGTADMGVIRDCLATMAKYGPQLRITPSSRLDRDRAGSSSRRRLEEGPVASNGEENWRDRMRRAQKPLH